MSICTVTSAPQNWLFYHHRTGLPQLGVPGSTWGQPSKGLQEHARGIEEPPRGSKGLQDASKSLQDARKCLARTILSPNLLPRATPGPSESLKNIWKSIDFLKMCISPPQTPPRRPKTPKDAPKTPLRRPRKPPRRSKTPSARPQDAPRRSQEAPKTPPKGGKFRSENGCHQDRGPRDPLEPNLEPNMAPCWPHVGPLRSHLGPNMAPTWAQEALLELRKASLGRPQGLISRTDAAQSTPATKHIMMTASIKLIHGGRGRRQRRSL